MQEINDSNFAQVIRSATPTLVDFYATWCGPCKNLSPIVERIAKKYQGRLNVVKLDIDRCPNAVGALGLQSVPTLILFRSGSEISRLTGLVPEARIEQILVGNI